jgi:hypothetical protein
MNHGQLIERYSRLRDSVTQLVALLITREECRKRIDSETRTLALLDADVVRALADVESQPDKQLQLPVATPAPAASATADEEVFAPTETPAPIESAPTERPPATMPEWFRRVATVDRLDLRHRTISIKRSDWQNHRTGLLSNKGGAFEGEWQPVDDRRVLTWRPCIALEQVLSYLAKQQIEVTAEIEERTMDATETYFVMLTSEDWDDLKKATRDQPSDIRSAARDLVRRLGPVRSDLNFRPGLDETYFGPFDESTAERFMMETKKLIQCEVWVEHQPELAEKILKGETSRKAAPDSEPLPRHEENPNLCCVVMDLESWLDLKSATYKQATELVRRLSRKAVRLHCGKAYLGPFEHATAEELREKSMQMVPHAWTETESLVETTIREGLRSKESRESNNESLPPVLDPGASSEGKAGRKSVAEVKASHEHPCPETAVDGAALVLAAKQSPHWTVWAIDHDAPDADAVWKRVCQDCRVSAARKSFQSTLRTLKRGEVMLFHAGELKDQGGRGGK